MTALGEIQVDVIPIVCFNDASVLWKYVCMGLISWLYVEGEWRESRGKQMDEEGLNAIMSAGWSRPYTVNHGAVLFQQQL